MRLMGNYAQEKKMSAPAAKMLVVSKDLEM